MIFRKFNFTVINLERDVSGRNTCQKKKKKFIEVYEEIKKICFYEELKIFVIFFVDLISR